MSTEGVTFRGVTLPARPTWEPDPVELEIAQIEAYGPRANCKRLEERADGQQPRIAIALTAFQNWRRRRGAALDGADVWSLPAPDAGDVRVYVALLRQKSRSWRDDSAAALREYFRLLERPDLYRLVEFRHGG